MREGWSVEAGPQLGWAELLHMAPNGLEAATNQYQGALKTGAAGPAQQSGNEVRGTRTHITLR